MDKPQIAVRPDGVILCIFNFTDVTLYSRPEEKTGDFIEISNNGENWTFAFPIEISPVAEAYDETSDDCQARVDQLVTLTDLGSEDFAIAGLCLTDYASAANPDMDYSRFPDELVDILPKCVEGYYKHIVEETQSPICFGRAITIKSDSKSKANSAEFLPTCFGCTATYSEYTTEKGIKDTKSCVNILMMVTGNQIPGSVDGADTAPSLMEVAFPDGDVDSSIDGVLGLDAGTFMAEVVGGQIGPIMKSSLKEICKCNCESLDSTPEVSKVDSMTYVLGDYACSTPDHPGRQSVPNMYSQSKLSFDMQLVGGASDSKFMRINCLFDYWVCYRAIENGNVELEITTSTSGRFAEPYGVRGQTYIDIDLNAEGTITLTPNWDGNLDGGDDPHLVQDCVLGLVEEITNTGSDLAEAYKEIFFNSWDDNPIGIHELYICYPTLCYNNGAVELQKEPDVEVPTTIVFPRGDLFTFCKMGLAYPYAITDDNAIICQMGYMPVTG